MMTYLYSVLVDVLRLVCFVCLLCCSQCDVLFGCVCFLFSMTTAYNSGYLYVG